MSEEHQISPDVTMYVLKSREDWLNHRARIGGSDASAVIGRNPWMTNIELWERKTHRVKAPDISDKPYVQYGHDAEPHLRALFALDHPELKVGYVDNNLFVNKLYPFGHASLDGWTTDQDGRMGVLEIKTTTIVQSMQKERWRDQIPENYFCQVLHYLLITGFEYADLRAQLKYESDRYFAAIKEYHIEREDVEDDIRYLAEAEKRFWRHVEDDKRPDLILPEI